MMSDLFGKALLFQSDIKFIALMADSLSSPKLYPLFLKQAAEALLPWMFLYTVLEGNLHWKLDDTSWLADMSTCLTL